MTDENEDQWLYGDSADTKDSPPPPTIADEFQEQEKQDEQNQACLQDGSLQEDPTNGPSAGLEDSNYQDEGGDGEDDSQGEQNAESETKENGTKPPSSQEGGDGGSDSDSEDDVHVVIGDIKSAPAYSSLNIKRGGLLTSSGGVPDKLKQPGKFSIDEFETIGTINGISAHEFNLDQLEDKPWRQPGADITDFFNYGFNEETWRAYCERQKKMRSESGVGLVLNASGDRGSITNTGSGPRIPPATITNYNSKYSGIMGPKRAGPPPGRKIAGTIDVIGGGGVTSRRNQDKSPPKENVIQVMTADRREYSRKPPFPDMTVPPPMPVIPVPPPVATFDVPPPGYQEPAPFFMPEPDPYYNSYEPTQDRQWTGDSTWQSSNLSIPLTGDDRKESGPKQIPTMIPPTQMPPMMREGRNRDRDRDRDRERDYEVVRERDGESHRDSVKEEDRERERSRTQYRHKERHRHRSRSRSRRHKSRSRSPSRRKKKSRRSERERSKEESE